MRDPVRTGLALRAWLGLARFTGPVAQAILRHRLKRGKEDPARWREKRGEASQPRPDGVLVWMHAVGVGEVLALPALIAQVRARRPDVNVLVTSSSRTSAEALAPNLPEGAVHQYLPLDVDPWVRKFLDHWRPDVSVWAERDVWPALIARTHARAIPMVLVNGRMNAASWRAKSRLRGLFRDLYARFDWIGVQEEESARHFAALGVPQARIAVTGSLKAAALPLADQPERRGELEAALTGRHVWIAASTHPGEEEILAEAHAARRRADPHACLIVAPRDPARAMEVVALLRQRAVVAEALPSDNRLPGPADAYVVTRIGQLGLWYRLADTAFVGGSLVDLGGHNPYEPALLGCAILHGPHVANFAEDYAAFHAAHAAREVGSAADLAAALGEDLAALRARGGEVAHRGEAGLEETAERIVALLDPASPPGAGG